MEGVSYVQVISTSCALEDILRIGVGLVEETVADDYDIHCLECSFTINVY